MRRWLCWYIVGHVMLAVALTGCGLPSIRPTGGSQEPSAFPSAQPTAFGLENAGPLPEYQLRLKLDAANWRLEGDEFVRVPNRTGKDLNEVIFRLYPNLPQYGGSMNVGEVWVDGQPASPQIRSDRTSLVVPLAQPLAPQSSVGISLTFGVDIPRYNSGYVLFGHRGGIWSLPDAYPLLAVHDGIAWHEEVAPFHGDAVFADAALYEVRLTLPPSLTVAATGTPLGDALNEDGQRVHRFAGGPLREFAWLASADYLVEETKALGTIVRSYYLPGDEAPGRAALNIAAAALRIYADAFGRYPFPEMVVAEAPLLHFGMEFSGLNLIGDDLYRAKRAELEDRLAHEVAHQWWYAQVGSDQVNTPWLDEGLAEHSTSTYYQDVFGEARANTLINQRWLVPYQAAVENGYDAVVNQPASAFGREYETIVYAKAALFFDVLRQTVGDETYGAILREYVQRYRWQIATPDDFLQVAEAVSGQDLDELYNRWVMSTQ